MLLKMPRKNMKEKYLLHSQNYERTNLPQAPSISLVPATHSHASPAPHWVFGSVHTEGLPTHESPTPPATRDCQQMYLCMINNLCRLHRTFRFIDCWDVVVFLENLSIHINTWLKSVLHGLWINVNCLWQLLYWH